MDYNFKNLFYNIPVELVHFVLVSLFSLIIGLSQRRLHPGAEEQKLFGTDRTFTFIGILGYLLLIADPAGKQLYLAGGIAVTAFLLVYYFFKIKEQADYGITTILIALITYGIPLVLHTQPFWLFLLVLVTVLIFTELKTTLETFSKHFDRNEFIILAKFIIMAGLILPILPNEPLFREFSVTPYKVWLAVVVISSVSYISYLLKKFIFKDAGIVLSGILGGLYSSTATTVVLSRKLKGDRQNAPQYYAAIILATAMMYIRVMILVFVFNPALFTFMLWPFAILVLVSITVPGIVLFRNKHIKLNTENTDTSDKNPLEFKAAMLFTIVFITFSVITQLAIQYYGTAGLSVLSFLVGIIDIDPFLINIFQGKSELSMHLIAIASFQAIISNNIAKCAYACFFAGKQHAKALAVLFGTVIVVNVLVMFIL